MLDHTENQYSYISSLGNFYALSFIFDETAILQKLEQKKDCWRTYNKNKPGYKRKGLSLISLDGSDSGEIDLTSIREYNVKNQANLCEMSFKTPTQHWSDFSEISSPLSEIQESLGRSHFLSLDSGGFFPPHRDIGPCFRLISFFNCSPSSLYFVLDGKKVNFSTGRLYFADTRKSHALFSFQENSIILVLNVSLTKESVEFVVKNLDEN